MNVVAIPRPEHKLRCKRRKEIKKRQLTTFVSQLRKMLPARLKRQIVARRLTLLEQENTSMLIGRGLVHWTFSIRGSIHFTPRIQTLDHLLATAPSSFPHCKRPPIVNISRAKYNRAGSNTFPHTINFNCVILWIL